MIVVFDSGIGGKTVVAEIKRKLPKENVVFVSDSEHCPYGEKSAEAVRKLVVRKLEEYLEDPKTSVVVLACNTATVAAIDWLRKKYPKTQFVGMVPALKPAGALSKTKKIAVLATPLTVKSAKYRKLIREFGRGARFYSIGCKGLARAIEDNHRKEIENLLKKYLTPLKSRGVDTVVLGCSHYVLVKHQIQKLLGKAITVIDSNKAVAARVSSLVQSSYGR